MHPMANAHPIAQVDVPATTRGIRTYKLQLLEKGNLLLFVMTVIEANGKPRLDPSFNGIFSNPEKLNRRQIQDIVPDGLITGNNDINAQDKEAIKQGVIQLCQKHKDYSKWIRRA